MKNFIATSAIAILVSVPALAQTTGTDQTMTDDTMAAGGFVDTVQESDILASEIMDAAVYAYSNGGMDRTDMGTGQDQQAAQDPQAGQDQQTAQDPQAGQDQQTAQDPQAGQDQQTAQDPQAGQDQQTAQDPQATGTEAGGEMSAARMIDASERENLEEIGDVSDVLVDQDGTIRGVIVGVGGFLGIGEREVVLGLDQLTFARDADDPETLMIVAQVDAQMLEEAPEFDREAFEQRTAGTEAQTGTMHEGAGTDMADAEPTEQDLAQDDVERDDTMAETQPAQDAGGEQWRDARDTFDAPEFEREGFQRAEASNFSVDELLGANVYDVNDENVGSVDDVVANGDGELEYVVMDIGGFLGIGAHTVALGLDEVTILQDGDDLRLYVGASDDELRNMPEYEG